MFVNTKNSHPLLVHTPNVGPTESEQWPDRLNPELLTYLDDIGRGRWIKQKLHPISRTFL